MTGRTNAAAMTSLTPPVDALSVVSPRGRCFFWQVAPTVYATEVTGHMTPEMSHLVRTHGEGLYRAREVVVGFHNWLAMTSYDSNCRVELTSWVLGHRAESMLHIGVRSRLVSMGVAVAELAVGKIIQVHKTREALDAAFARVMASRSP